MNVWTKHTKKEIYQLRSKLNPVTAEIGLDITDKTWYVMVMGEVSTITQTCPFLCNTDVNTFDEAKDLAESFFN